MKTHVKTNRLFAALLAVMMIISMLPIKAVSPEEGNTSTGAQSATSNIKADVTISKPEDLVALAENVKNGETYEGKTVALTANISLGSDFAPIGTTSAPFKGTFDGNYHVVSGLAISSGSAVGLFGVVNGGTIKNVVVRGSVSGSSNVAGVVGSLTDGNVYCCGNEATISGSSNAGGVVGAVNGTCTINECYNSGSVTGTTGFIGGVTGQHWRAGTVTNSYNVGQVKGPATVGGVIGGHKAASPSFSNCYNAGAVIDSTGNKNNVNAVIGATRGTDMSNSFYLAGTGSDSRSGVSEVSKLSADQLGASFEADSKNINNGYPILTWQNKIDKSAPVAPGFTEKTELSATLSGYIKDAVNSAKTNAEITGSLLGNESYLKGASSTATDWMALAMGRFGYSDSDGYHFMIDDGTGYEDYLSAMLNYIETTYEENDGILHRVKATEWHRAAVAIAAIGGDPTCFGSYNGSDIDLIADGSYECKVTRGPGAQGLNGWIWGLIAMDIGMYDLPEDAKYSREDFIVEILKCQLNDGVNGNEYGGFVLGGYGSSSDVDMTAMAIQALAPYYNDDTVYTYTNASSKKEVSKTVGECIDEALDRLGAMMNKDGGFTSWNTNNVESIAQVVVALCSVGIDPAKDERFITSSGKTLLDGMLNFRLADGGFCHVIGGGWNSMANDQATYALVSYWRLENGMRALYDMRDDFTDEAREAIDIATKAIVDLPAPTSEDYKASLKSALAKFRSVPKNERRYVYNYSTLSAAIKLVGGEDKLDTDDPYIASIMITTLPKKTTYYEGEMFDTSEMVVTAFYNDGDSVEVTDYKLSKTGALELNDSEIYVISGILKAKIDIEVLEKMPWKGDGTTESPYIIKNASDLAALAEKVGKGKSFKDVLFELNNDIDLSSISNWTQIGSSSSKQFDGIFDGKGYVIKNLKSTSGGLFGYVGSNAIIRNVGIASGKIGSETTNSSFFGGIAGWSNGADFINCFNCADIYAGGYSGGIVGTIRNGGKSNITNCYNKGNIISKSSSIGGIVGHLDTTRAQGGTSVEVTIDSCYNTGSIKGTDTVGGIVGRAQDGHTIKNCYNIGEIIVDEGNDGGAIAGSLTSGNTVENCYYDSSTGKVGIVDEADLRAIGKTSAEMKTDAFVALLGNSFKKDSYGIVNGGYPILGFEKTTEAELVDAVIDKIDDIGSVTLESEDKINDARSAYDALDDELKKHVSNLSALVAAESSIAEIKALANAIEAAKAQLDSYKDLSDYEEEQQNELSAIIKAGKANIADAENVDEVNEALSSAKTQMDAVKTKAQLSSERRIKAVEELIAELDVTSIDDEDEVIAAREAYDGLSSGEKALVQNYNKLLDAEGEIARLKEEAGGTTSGDDTTVPPTTDDDDGNGTGDGNDDNISGTTSDGNLAPDTTSSETNDLSDSDTSDSASGGAFDSVSDSASDSISDSDTSDQTSCDDTTGGDMGNIVAPGTGDAIMIALIALAVAVIVILVIAAVKRRKN